jgi:uncharacterized zinc-type alcohol dehydrogenase-like protein
MPNTRAFAVSDAKSPFAPFAFDRREPGPHDVQLDILFCGVCHSDLHTARSEWPGTVYPCVPGHEIAGKVTRVGAEVTSFKPGDLAAVGCMVDSCKTCPSCRDGHEQYCDTFGVTFTYNSEDKHGTNKVTYGGYSSQITVDSRFCLRVPEKLVDRVGLAAVAPLLCAGITMYSPLKHWGIQKGKRVGIVGLGGLGHMGVKLSHALGAHTSLFTTSASKIEDAKRLGADEVILSKDADAMNKHANTFDLIVDTVSASHDLDAYTSLLARDGTLVLIGVPEQAHPSPSAGNLIFRRRSIAGSLIGGIRETQEMLDFCADHGIGSDVEVIPIQKIDEAYTRMQKSDVKYRFVVDCASLGT